MKLTEKQADKIIQKLNECGIDLIQSNSKYDNIEIISEEYFIEKLNEALEE